MTDTRSAVSYAQPPPDYTAFTDDTAEHQPPRLPTEPFLVFGEPQSDIASVPTLAEQNVPTLYDESAPPLFELKKINHRILFSFQKLVGIIAIGSESPDDCLEHIRHLFMNAHSLLNKLRSFQAYENMHHFLREQNRRLDEFRQEFDAKLADIAILKPP
jgi:hypothetical protein